MNVCMYVCMYVRVYVCMYVYHTAEPEILFIYLFSLSKRWRQHELLKL